MARLEDANALHSLGAQWVVAAEAGRLAKLETLLKEDSALLEFKDGYGNTALILAALHGRLACVEKLLSLGADPLARSREGWTALLSAVRKNRSKVALALIEVSDPKATSDHGETALEFACSNGSLSLSKLLVEHALWSQVQLSSALSKAAARGHWSCVKTLREAGCDISGKDDRGATALMHACKGDRFDFAKALLKAGADPFEVNAFGDCALSIAAACGHERCVAALAGLGAELIANYEGVTPLMRACEFGDQGVAARMAKTMVPESHVGARDHGGRKASDWASDSGHEALAEWLGEFESALDEHEELEIIAGACQEKPIRAAEKTARSL